jgi:hypothetical protein
MLHLESLEGGKNNKFEQVGFKEPPILSIVEEKV